MTNRSLFDPFSVDAWIITGGTKSGVMELVGQAAKDYMLQNGSYQQNLVVIGIPSLNVVSNGDIFKTFDQSNFLSQVAILPELSFTTLNSVCVRLDSAVIYYVKFKFRQDSVTVIFLHPLLRGGGVDHPS